MEQRVRRRKRKRDIQGALIAAIGIVGVLSIAAFAPGAAMLLKYVGTDRGASYKAKSALGRLAQKGLVTFSKKGEISYARLTEAGLRVLAIENARLDLQKVRKRRWDGKWRMVVFDIPERRRHVRERLRSIVRHIGFFRLQDSVWVYPYDSEDFITLLKAELRTGKDILYAVVEEIENDTPIRQFFHLPRRI
ncbi:MAG: CRISPR-associated endonuclease Cas2 [Minisyncoccia bacterium]